MRYNVKKIISALSMAGNGSSGILDLRNVVNMSLQFSVSGASSPTGTVAITFADDCSVSDSGSISGGNFGVDASVSSPTVTANGTKMVNIANVGHLFCQVNFTAGTGTGTLDVFLAEKGV